MTEFESEVTTALRNIQASLATTAQAQVDHGRRIGELEKFNETQEARTWIKSLVVGAAVIVGHPIARKLGLDI